MISNYSNYIFYEYMVRNRKKQKLPFAQDVVAFLCKEGYSADILKQGKFMTHHNIVAGDPKSAKVIFTAHYDTPPVLPFPNFITPKNLFLFTLYQLFITICILIPIFLMFAFGVYLSQSFQLSPWIPVLLMYFSLIAVLILFFAIPNKHNANDNTSGVITLLEIAQKIPKEMRNEVAFVFFDHEELGMLGSSAFASKNKAFIHDKLVINFDCVSDGDTLMFVPRKKVKRNDALMQKLCEVMQCDGKKQMKLEKRFVLYPSDQMMFRRSVAVAALRKSSLFGYYLSRIHTSKDTVFEEENIELLAVQMVELFLKINEEGMEKHV